MIEPGMIEPDAVPAPASRFCFGCGKPIHPSARACPHCGAEQPQTPSIPSPMSLATLPVPSRRGLDAFCRTCGAPLNAAAPLCPRCGAPQQPPAPAGNGRTRVAAALFAIFLGGVGGHRFYLGRPLSGIFYLLFCWTFVPSMIALVEAVILLTMTDTVFARRYP